MIFIYKLHWNLKEDFEECPEYREELSAVNPGLSHNSLQGKPMFPLPKHKYPVHTGFPVHLVEYTLKDKARSQNLNREIRQREQVLKDMEKNVKSVDASHQEWMVRHQSVTATEIQHRVQVMEEEKKHMRDLLKTEEAISKAKIAQLITIEAAAKEELILLEKMALESEELIKV